jgi:hypothetical protein
LLPQQGVEALLTAALVDCGGAMGCVVGRVGDPITDEEEDKEVSSLVASST